MGARQSHFGKIDNFGSRSIDILVADTWEDHGGEFLNDFIDFIDAQKLRTPKGLDWLLYFLRSNIRTNPQLARTFSALIGNLPPQDFVLANMLAVRQMHLTMWFEAIWEIVSAENSETKFIISDHPVTVYNPGAFPLSIDCRYPSDPHIGLIGTRTIVPLDLNHCLIITNREHALEPGKRILKPRTNARHFDQPTPFYIPGIIRGRSLDNSEVCSINYIIKRRARRYIAAACPEWLQPEKNALVTHWSKIDPILQPPTDKVDRTESVIWGGDGWSVGMDAYGRPLPDKDHREMHDFFERLKHTPPGSTKIAD